MFRKKWTNIAAKDKRWSSVSFTFQDLIVDNLISYNVKPQHGLLRNTCLKSLDFTRQDSWSLSAALIAEWQNTPKSSMQCVDFDLKCPQIDSAKKLGLGKRNRQHQAVTVLFFGPVSSLCLNCPCLCISQLDQSYQTFRWQLILRCLKAYISWLRYSWMDTLMFLSSPLEKCSSCGLEWQRCTTHMFVSTAAWRPVITFKTAKPDTIWSHNSWIVHTSLSLFSNKTRLATVKALMNAIYK